MSAVICPWCQSEIIQEEGQEPEKFCPVCDNELDGYRTLKLNIGDEEDEEDELDEEEDSPMVSIDEDIGWVEDEEFTETDDELQQFEETVEQLLNEQELVPECPFCREFMIETGERLVAETEFRPRVSEALGETILSAPFTITMFTCPSCFTVQSFLGDSYRHQIVRRLSQNAAVRSKEHDA